MLLNLTSSFLLGLGLSFSHCFFMCGGFALIFNQTNASKKELLFYNLTRITTYFILASFAYFLGFFFTSLNYEIFIYFILGCFCMVLGFSLLMRSKILDFIENKYLYKQLVKLAIKYKNHKYKSFIFGLLNGLFPCGLVYFFIAKSMLAKSFLESSLNIIIFGLSTLPAMYFGGLLARRLKELKIAQNIFFILIIFYGIYLCFLALKLSR